VEEKCLKLEFERALHGVLGYELVNLSLMKGGGYVQTADGNVEDEQSVRIILSFFVFFT
jgi:hypothetical protein